MINAAIMYKYIFVLLSIILIFLSSCSTNSNQDVHDAVSMIYLKSDEKKVPVDSLFKNLRIIVPETTDSSLITNVNRIRIYDGKIYILCSDNRLLAFDMDGKCILQLSEVGSGPGQYINAKDFDIDCTDGSIFMLADNRILRYKPDGSFSDEIAKVGYDHEIAVTKDYIYVSKNTYPDAKLEDYQITIINRKTNSISEKLPTLEEYAPFCSYAVHGLNRIGEKIWFTRKFDNKIYTLSDGNIDEWLSIEFGDRFFVPATGERIECGELNNKTHDEKLIYTIGNVIATDSICIFATNQHTCGIVSVNDHSVTLTKSFTDVPNGLLSGIPHQVSALTPTIAFILDSANIGIMAEISGNKYINDLSKKLTAESNPLIYIYEIKNH